MDWNGEKGLKKKNPISSCTVDVQFNCLIELSRSLSLTSNVLLFSFLEASVLVVARQHVNAERTGQWGMTDEQRCMCMCVRACVRVCMHVG